MQILAGKNLKKGQNPILPAPFCFADDLRYQPGIRRYLRLSTEPVFTGLEGPYIREGGKGWGITVTGYLPVRI